MKKESKSMDNGSMVMKIKKELKVQASGTSLVQDYEALESGVRRFIGRQYDASVGVAGGWVPKEEISVIPFRAEYVQAIKDGDLSSDDSETLRLCGIKSV